MAHVAYALTNIEDVPAKIVDFITNHLPSWSAATGSAGPNGETTATMTFPAGTNSPSRTFKIMALNGTTQNGSGARLFNNYMWFSFDGGNPVADECRVYAPTKPTGTGSSDAAPRNAVQLHMFGHDAASGDATFIAGAVEFDNKHYRHFYLGRIERHGSYGDGIVMTGSNVLCRKGYYSDPYEWDSPEHRHPFGGLAPSGGASDEWQPPYSGGLLIDHPDDATRFRPFHMEHSTNYESSESPDKIGDGTEVFGGPNDGPIDGLIASGFAPISTANLLATIELFSNNDDGANGRFYRPLGHPIGVRAVNLQNLTPGQSVTVGTSTWWIFPLGKMNLVDDEADYTTSRYYPDNENTGPFGIAYKE